MWILTALQLRGSLVELELGEQGAVFMVLLQTHPGQSAGEGSLCFSSFQKLKWTLNKVIYRKLCQRNLHYVLPNSSIKMPSCSTQVAETAVCHIIPFEQTWNCDTN